MNSLPPLSDADRNFDARLIEVMAATFLVALLMLLALRDYRSYLDKTYVAQGYGLARMFQIDAELFHAEQGDWSISDTVSDAGGSVQSLQLENGVITVRYRQTAGLSADAALSWRPTVKTGVKDPATLFWSCGYAARAGFTAHGANQTTLPPDVLTAVCRLSPLSSQ